MSFNEALLAKQVWRKEDSIIHKVLKEKYFPNTTIFNANQKPRDNYL